MPDPFVLADLEKAASRLADAVIHDEKIAVFGDYDVDGATSAACLIKFMRQLGITPELYVPNRMTEGYGPSVPAFKSLIDEGVGVIVTVDCGTMAHEALAFAKEQSVDVIVADAYDAAPFQNVAVLHEGFVACIALRQVLLKVEYETRQRVR